MAATCSQYSHKELSGGCFLISKRLGEDNSSLGRLEFLPIFSYYSSNLFGGIEKFRIFASDKGGAVICHPEYITTKKLQILRNTLKLNLLNCIF